jgi:hypothetical protein
MSRSIILRCGKRYRNSDEKTSQEKFTLLINEGIEKGIFRKISNNSIIVMTYINAIQAIITPELLSQMPFIRLTRYLKPWEKLYLKEYLLMKDEQNIVQQLSKITADEFTETKSGE